MSRLYAFVVACLLSLAACAAHAAQSVDADGDPAVEQRLRNLANELRCLVCQNQSLADSHADLAIDLRNEVREQIKAGKSDAQIRVWLTERYGDFVLYRPPLKATTVLLWVGPAILLAAALIALVVTLRRRRLRIEPSELSETERARAEALLGSRSDPSHS
ncbi:MAG TPA: cytochrome c-type biogenesis protein [Burkholderiales bacterium]|nr:cytochrome c-type biogenesis protein [Burkholderiales bacterium]